MFKHGDSKGEKREITIYEKHLYMTIIYNIIKLSMKKEMCKTSRAESLQQNKNKKRRNERNA